MGQGETGGLPLEERLEQGFCVLAKAGGRQATAVVYVSFLMTLLLGKVPLGSGLGSLLGEMHLCSVVGVGLSVLPSYTGAPGLDIQRVIRTSAFRATLLVVTGSHQEMNGWGPCGTYM